MNSHTSFALLAMLVISATLSVSVAHAGEETYNDMDKSDKMTSKQAMLAGVPISIWTDKMSYEHNEMIKLKGHVANWSSQVPVTLTVTNPLSTIVAVDQVIPDSDGSFEIMMSTAGELWKYDGTYVIKVNYGSVEKNNRLLVELTGGVDYEPVRVEPDGDCITVRTQDSVNCIPFSITGGTLASASINTDDNSIVLRINSDGDGILTIDTPQSVIKGVFFVWVDNEEWDDVKIGADNVKVMFPAGTEKIEIFGTWVIPEFGTIAVMILVVAIISIIAISARSRLSIMPRY